MQGIDIPDIRVVVQWKVPSSLSTLWQRFGRAGRDRSEEATAVLLAEKEYFDEERKLKMARQEKRKRKMAAQLPTISPSKRPHISSSSIAPPSINRTESNGDSADESGSDISGGEEDWRLREMYTRYTERERRTAKPKKRKVDVEAAMDDFINAKSYGMSCRRMTLNVYFENNKASM